MESDTTSSDGKSDPCRNTVETRQHTHADALTNVDEQSDVFRGASDVVDVTRQQADALNVDERSSVSYVSQSDVLGADALQSDMLNVDASQLDAFNVPQFDVLNVEDKLDAPWVSSDVANATQDDALSNVDEETHVSGGVSDVVDATQYSQEHSSNVQEQLDIPRAVLDLVGAKQQSQKDASNLANKSDVSKAVLDLVGATQHLQKDPSDVESINNLIDRLKHLLLQERQTYAFMRQNSESRKKLESLHNLIQYLESQVERLQKAVRRRGLKYYLASISNKVRGHEVGRIGQSMESELQSWLDQQSVREVTDIISKGSEDAQVHAISSFESVVQKGYNSLLQETILSAGLVEKLAALLAPGVASWRVAKEAVFALSALIDFNKDIFVSLVLMAKMVENVLRLMRTEPDEHVLVLVCVIKGMLSVGHTVVVDEIYAHNGVSKIVELLDHESQVLQHAAMDCVLELAYYGRVEVVEKMFKLEVVKKLAMLQQAHMTEGDCMGMECYDKHAKQENVHALDLAANWLSPPATLTPMADGNDTSSPFANAVTKFALHLSIGTGLRKREKRALKQEFLRQIREVMKDDAEIANITAEVLWAP